MTPEQRSAAFNASLVYDLNELSPEFRAQIEARGRQLVEEHRRSAPE